MELNELIQAVRSYTTAPEVEPVLTEAYQIAAEAHRGFRRITGDSFLSHPLAVASILAEWHAPLDIIAVGLLHDIHSPDYSRGYDLDLIRFRLGSGIRQLLEAAIALNVLVRRIEGEFVKVADVNNIGHHIASVLQWERDVVIIKIADRLHNLQTISSLPQDYQERIARIGFNLLVPLVERLGMGRAKLLLENYSFEIFKPTYHKMLKQQCGAPHLIQEIDSLVSELQQRIAAYMPNSEVRWQFDSLYTLYHRQIEQNFKLGKPLHASPSSLGVVDAGSFVILLEVEEELECYRCLAIFHKLYSAVSGQFRDLIGEPSENGYRSLHTQVRHPCGKVLNLIIRTRAMDLIAERGITARWWNVPEELLPQLPQEMKPLERDIQVFTPKGELKHLPFGATPIDFAYSIHSYLGNHCIGAIVNGKSMELEQPLKTGDTIEIISGGEDAEPKLDWLEVVQTHQASHSIRQWFLKNRRNDLIDLGRTLIDTELQPLNLILNDTHVWQQLTRLAVKESLKNGKDLLASIALKRFKASEVVKQLQLLLSPKYLEPPYRVFVLTSTELALPRVYAGCCNPVPPFDIVGRRRKEKLVIHRLTCSRIKGLEELTPVKWDIMPREPNYVVVVEALYQQGLETDLISAVKSLGCDIQNCNTYRHTDEVLVDAYIYLGKTTSEERTRIREILEKVAYVNHVEIMHALLLPRSTQQSVTRPAIHYPNPYSPKIAIGSRFYGREVECQRISARLHDPFQNTAILLWGQKRIGKSSLLLHLEQHWRRDFLPVFVDVQGLREVNTIQFLYHLMTRISEVLKEKITESAPKVTVPQQRHFKKDVLTYFDTFMVSLQRITRYQPLVIIFDEFQCLCSLKEEVISRDAIFSRLRSYSQYGQGIHLILSGGGLRSQLTEQCGIASLLNVSYDEKLNYLEKKAASQLIIDGLTRVGAITEDAVDYLLTITACHPYYLQLLCSKLYEHAQEEKIAITREVSTLLVHEWLSAADASRFHHLWEATDIVSTQRNKLILSAIAHIGMTHSEVEYSRLAALVDTLVPEQDLVRALADLSDLGVLKHNHLNYTIEVELFACWLRQHSPFELVSKEARFV